MPIRPVTAKEHILRTSVCVCVCADRSFVNCNRNVFHVPPHLDRRKWVEYGSHAIRQSYQCAISPVIVSHDTAKRIRDANVCKLLCTHSQAGVKYIVNREAACSIAIKRIMLRDLTGPDSMHCRELSETPLPPIEQCDGLTHKNPKVAPQRTSHKVSHVNHLVGIFIGCESYVKRVGAAAFTKAEKGSRNQSGSLDSQQWQRARCNDVLFT